MTNFEKHIRKAAEGYSLSDAEKARMERVVVQYMRFKPVRGERKALAAHLTAWSWIAYLHRPLVVGLILTIVSSSTAAYAAEGALPGDALYSVKTYINEPVRVALARGTEAKAEVRIALAERRIEEATVLSAEGRLDENTEESLTMAFVAQADEAAKEIEETESTDSDAAFELSTRFETRLAAHDEVLAVITETEENRLSKTIKEQSAVVASLRERATDHAAASSSTMASSSTEPERSESEEAPAEMAMTFSLRATTVDATAMQKETEPQKAERTYDERSAQRMRSSAEKQLKAAQKSARHYIARLGDDSQEEAEEQFEKAEQLIEEGTNLLESDSTAAFHVFQSSLIISERLQVFLRAAPALEKVRWRDREQEQKENTLEENRKEELLEEQSVEAIATTTATTSPEIELATTSTSTAERVDNDASEDDSARRDSDQESPNDENDQDIRSRRLFNQLFDLDALP